MNFSNIYTATNLPFDLKFHTVVITPFIWLVYVGANLLQRLHNVTNPLLLTNVLCFLSNTIKKYNIIKCSILYASYTTSCPFHTPIFMTNLTTVKRKLETLSYIL
jgi:hypothetical protein